MIKSNTMIQLRKSTSLVAFNPAAAVAVYSETERTMEGMLDEANDDDDDDDDGEDDERAKGARDGRRSQCRRRLN